MNRPASPRRVNPLPVVMPTYPVWNPHKTGRKKLFEELDKKIGRRIQMRRLELKVAQCWVAERCGVAVNTYGRYEKGRVAVPAGRLAALAAALSCSVDMLIGLPKPDEIEKTLAEKFLTDREANRFLVLALKLADNQRDAVRALMESMLDPSEHYDPSKPWYEQIDAKM